MNTAETNTKMTEIENSNFSMSLLILRDRHFVFLLRFPKFCTPRSS